VLLELDSREAVTEAGGRELGVGVVSSMEVSPDPRVQAVPIQGDGLVNRHMLGCMERPLIAFDPGVFRVGALMVFGGTMGSCAINLPPKRRPVDVSARWTEESE
jgi:hypothetical protein